MKETFGVGVSVNRKYQRNRKKNAEHEDTLIRVNAMQQIEDG